MTFQEQLNLYIEELSCSGQHFDFIAANPNLPRFVIQEIYSHPERHEIMRSQVLTITKDWLCDLQRHIDESAATKATEWIDARMLLLDIVSLNLFAFIGYPFVSLMFDGLVTDKKVFFERFLRLYKYVDLDSLLCQLWEIRTDNNIAFKNVNNAIMYWALAEEHPLKTDTRAGFNTNIAYSASEIQTILSPIIKYHLHKILKPRKYISLFKAIYATKRLSFLVK